jgi:integral membrane sensor domain MASE1
LLSWLRPCELQRPLNQAYFLEAGLLTASTVLIGAIVFLALLPWEMDLYPVVFAAFPFVGWAALRFALRGTSAVSLLLTGLAIIGTAQGVGAFHQGGMSQIWFFYCHNRVIRAGICDI